MACPPRGRGDVRPTGPELPCSSRARPVLIDCAPLVRPRAIAVVALAFVASGCRGWHGGNTYLRGLSGDRKREEASYRFGLPGSAWRPVRHLSDVQVAWVNEDIGAVIQIHSQCDEQGDSSLDEYTDHLRIDWTDWKVVSQTPERLANRAALRTVVDGKLDGVLRRNEFVIVKKNGCLFDLQYSAPPDRFSRGAPDFQQVVRGFQFPLRGA
jgi:hypothetical protein